jgi:hypothetical protein
MKFECKIFKFQHNFDLKFLNFSKNHQKSSNLIKSLDFSLKWAYLRHINHEKESNSMSINSNLLVPEFRTKLETLINECKNRGFIMVPYFGIRTPFEQGKLWRQSRTSQEIKAKIAILKEQGADFLAFCIESVGPCNGPLVTKAIPGLSWHQFGEACDCMWSVNGRAEWSTKKLVNGINGYIEYAKIASSQSLDAGGLWPAKDWPHVQLRKASSPLKIMSLSEIDKIMKERFGDK